MSSRYSYRFQSTHPVRGGTFCAGVGDVKLLISIHPPREGWDSLDMSLLTSSWEFQSTHPVRGGTYPLLCIQHNPGISIHPPREGWDGALVCAVIDDVISIHPPREGWDLKASLALSPPLAFQSTHPVRGGTVRRLSAGAAGAISIHPPREGWDHWNI